MPPLPQVDPSPQTRASVNQGSVLFAKVTSNAGAVFATWTIKRDGLQQEVAKFGHDLIYNRQQSVELVAQDLYWSLVELVFSGPASQTVTVDQWIQNAAGKIIRKRQKVFTHSGNWYCYMEWPISTES